MCKQCFPNVLEELKYLEDLRSGKFFQITEEHIRIWVSNGVDFGYPECCIEWFCSSKIPRELTPAQKTIIEVSNGFIPCPACAEKVAGGLPLAALITHRDKRLKPFPYE